jgi:outer membrane protein insertion porin family
VNTASLRDLEPTVEEKLRQWQQERLERRLRGEYESAARRLTDVVSLPFSYYLAGRPYTLKVSDSLNSPARIVDVRVQGPTATRSSFLGCLIRPHLNVSYSSSIAEGTLQDVFRRVDRMTGVLERSDIFSSVQATLERSRSPFAGENDVDVVLKVRDRPRMFLKGSTETGNGEGNAVWPYRSSFHAAG